MADLISREAALDVLVTSPNFHTTLTRIEELPAVDAVPVEWLCKYRAGLTNAWDLDVSAINNILCQWKKEHGTANSDKNGVWESLGHRIGSCKHPWSEDFRCSLCGYEAYTVFYSPPERCPVCDAKMSIKQEAR